MWEKRDSGVSEDEVFEASIYIICNIAISGCFNINLLRLAHLINLQPDLVTPRMTCFKFLKLNSIINSRNPLG